MGLLGRAISRVTAKWCFRLLFPFRPRGACGPNLSNEEPGLSNSLPCVYIRWIWIVHSWLLVRSVLERKTFLETETLSPA